MMRTSAILLVTLLVTSAVAPDHADLVTEWVGITNVNALTHVIDQLPPQGVLTFSVPEADLARAQSVRAELPSDLRDRIVLSRLPLGALVRYKIESIGTTDSTRQLVVPAESLQTRLAVAILGVGAELLEQGYELVVIVPEGSAQFNLPGIQVTKSVLSELVATWTREQLARELERSSA